MVFLLFGRPSLTLGHGEGHAVNCRRRAIAKPLKLNILIRFIRFSGKELPSQAHFLAQLSEAKAAPTA